MNPESGDLPPPARELREAAAAPLAARLSPKYLLEHCLVPLRLAEDGALVIAAGRPLDPTVADELAWTYGRPVQSLEVPTAELEAALLSARSPGTASQPADARGSDLELVTPDDDAADEAQLLANEAPVVRLVNQMILEALQARASDLHLESTPEGPRVRHRIDGVLHDVSRPPRAYQAALISRVKVMASLNIAERRLPQDGRIRLRVADREVDLRVSTVPSLHGEGVVLRILDRGTQVRDLGELGMAPALFGGFRVALGRSHGIVLATGPTGSGKTTTLYAGLRSLADPGLKIITVEDPIEYQLEGVTQIPVHRRAGLTFASALRSILRHDPDIIMVGEMRDPETAQIAIQSALTGHLVLSTLHTNDAPAGLTRLVDMGVEPYLIAATLEAVLAQRLVRVVCERCAEPDTPSEAELAPFNGLRGGKGRRRSTFRRGRGCGACGGTGFHGRTGLYELLVLSDELRDLVVRRAPLQDIRAAGRRHGWAPLREDGWDKACRGITTLGEVLRVSRGEEPQ